MWNEITYPFPNFNGFSVEVWEWIGNFVTLYNGCNYLFMLRLLKLIRVSKSGPCVSDTQHWIAFPITHLLLAVFVIYGYTIQQLLYKCTSVNVCNFCELFVEATCRKKRFTKTSDTRNIHEWKVCVIYWLKGITMWQAYSYNNNITISHFILCYLVYNFDSRRSLLISLMSR